MTDKLRVIQWGTGNVGKHSVEAVQHHRVLEPGWGSEVLPLVGHFACTDRPFLSATPDGARVALFTPGKRSDA